jgi:hypothetical protein
MSDSGDEDSFFLFLHSSDKSSVDNIQSDFVTNLGKPIVGQYQCGLVELGLRYSWNNVTEDSCKFFIAYDEMLSMKTINEKLQEEQKQAYSVGGSFAVAELKKQYLTVPKELERETFDKAGKRVLEELKKKPIYTVQDDHLRIGQSWKVPIKRYSIMTGHYDTGTELCDAVSKALNYHYRDGIFGIEVLKTLKYLVTVEYSSANDRVLISLSPGFIFGFVGSKLNNLLGFPDTDFLIYDKDSVPYHSPCPPLTIGRKDYLHVELVNLTKPLISDAHRHVSIVGTVAATTQRDDYLVYRVLLEPTYFQLTKTYISHLRLRLLDGDYERLRILSGEVYCILHFTKI